MPTATVAELLAGADRAHECTVTVAEVRDAAHPLPDDQARTWRHKTARCARPLWFVRTKGGAMMPYTTDASPHWADCPGADELRRRPRATQTQLPMAINRDPVNR